MWKIVHIIFVALIAVLSISLYTMYTNQPAYGSNNFDFWRWIEAFSGPQALMMHLVEFLVFAWIIAVIVNVVLSSKKKTA